MKVRQVTVCHTCRARKLGCAMTQRKCAGYDYDLIFVPMSKTGSRIRHSSPKKPPKESGRSEARRRAALIKTEPPDRPDHGLNLYPISPSLHWPLQHVILLLIQNFAPTLDPGDADIDLAVSPPRICGSWVELLPGLADTSANERTIAAPVRTLAMSILARGHRGLAPMGDALTAHSTALRSVHRALAHADSASTNVLTAAVMCLMISELILPDADASASQAHASGLEALLKLQGPAFYAHGQAHRLFIENNGSHRFQTLQIVQAICTRRLTFLAEPAWKTVPFKTIPPTPLQELITIAAGLPQLLKEHDDCMAGRLPKHNTVTGPRRALSSHLHLLDVLEDWHHKYRSHIAQPSHWAVHRKTHGPCLWFSDITVANCLTHYWALWMICATNIRTIRAEHPDLLAMDVLIGEHVPESTAVTHQLRQAAISILESVHFLMQDDMKLYGATSLILPLQTACQHLKTHYATEPGLIQACDSTIDWIELRGFHFIGHFLRLTAGG
ncbi:fungal specific transcription factor domain-containing protein [Purpureocillium lavendulum]|uniref:Fungal specific transcription factor domain-containing protein n=1 Tax=Purpureocillium lavendulum TaxID=1247861 RepID=A0AB34FI97_9HYPO|nr:fungal specific transcription factor domain-containing protein [Purpureocillium lavendulum]